MITARIDNFLSKLALMTCFLFREYVVKVEPEKLKTIQEKEKEKRTRAAPGRENRRASVDSNVDSPSLRLHDSRSGPLTLRTSNRASLLDSEVEVVYAP